VFKDGDCETICIFYCFGTALYYMQERFKLFRYFTANTYRTQQEIKVNCLMYAQLIKELDKYVKRWWNRSNVCEIPLHQTCTSSVEMSVTGQV